MNQTIRHGLPMLASGQAQKEVTHNEALLLIDRRLQLGVTSRRVATPPVPALAGSAFIVPGDAIGEWAGQADRIASFDGHGWTFDTPQQGWLAWIADEGRLSIFDGCWSDGTWSVTALRIGDRTMLSALPTDIPSPVGGPVVDAECRQIVDRMLAALRAQGLIK